MTDTSFSDSMAASYDRRLATIVQRLRDLADEVERDGKPRPNITRRDGAVVTDDYIGAAANAIHAVTWGVANLNLDGLVATASDVHYARELERELEGDTESPT